ncbi:MAG: branched-chain amino acid transaminase [Dehalococcoidia bacterium]|jgi:branched-chain amino acid aminotransferase|nr:branched-chain amino acid transaminase [Dehalococcoidia bacterium]
MSQQMAYFEGKFVPIEDANLNVMTHAFNYGSAVFEGIRGNWNPAHEELYLFKVREHIDRLVQSARILRMNGTYDADEISNLVVELARRCDYKEDMYIRPMVYKSGLDIGPAIHSVEDKLLIYVRPLGDYLDPNAGATVMTSSWRRVDDTSIPARAKVSGLYVNNGLATSEAKQNGMTEAIMLNQDGHVSEGAGENLVMIRNGVLISPPQSDNILEGITLDTALFLASEKLNLPVERRTIDRSELYIADELFMTGTAAHVTPVTEVDRVPVGDGQPGVVSRKLQKLFFDAITGELTEYESWLIPVYGE